MVGSINGQAAVANSDQIVEAVSQGVYRAVVSAFKQSGGTGQGGEFHFYLDGKEMSARVEKAQKERGASILAGGVI